MKLFFMTVAVFKATLIVVGNKKLVPVAAFHPTPPPLQTTTNNRQISTSLHATKNKKPVRLIENAPGVLYVNDHCINCAACSGFAPDTFIRSSGHHIVHEQPSTQKEIRAAQQALAACPVAAIRIETLAQRRHGLKDKSKQVEWTEQDSWLVEQMKDHEQALFPYPFLHNTTDVYWLGHHNEASFGAIPYMLRVPGEKDIWIMVDTPKYSPSAIRAVTSLTGPKGPDYLVLTHVDDTADHLKWAKEFEYLQRIFHESDLGKYNWLNDQTLDDVEILLARQPGKLESLTAYTLEGTVLPQDWMETTSPQELPVVLLHTPGHSPGSITLYRRPTSFFNDGILFTGDTYAYSTRTNAMSGFPRYGNNLQLQAKTLQSLAKLEWSMIAPGHGHSRDYRSDQSSKNRLAEMEPAIQELITYRQ